MTSASLYARLFAAAPSDATCLRLSDGRILRYGELKTRAAQLANVLIDRGCAPGSRLVAQVDKSSDAVALYLACLRAGVIYVPLNTAYTAAEVQYFVEDAQATLVVCRPDAGDALRAALSSVLARAPETLLTLGTHADGSLVDAIDRSHPAREPAVVSGEDIACMLYTSGTTGRSKGAMLSHRCLISNARALYKAWAFGEGDVLLHALPIFHVHGLFIALNVAMIGGHEVIYLDRFDPQTVIAQLPHASVFMGVPTYYTRLLSTSSFDQDVCRNIRLFTSGSAPMTEQLHAAITERTGHIICERYGMTECGIITSNPYVGERIPGTVGYALPGYEVRERKGIIEVRGEHLFAGYWRKPAQTSEAFTEDGWFITGDIGDVAEDGRVRLSGRTSDLIISGGYNIYPKEIELLIDDVAGVAESAVVGVPHPDFGEGVVAVVVLEDGYSQDAVEEEVRRRCHQQLARFKHPKRWRFVEELPRNAMSKVQKNVLRERYARLFAT